MFPITALLATFALLIIASATFFISKRVQMPYTALLALVGSILVPIMLLVPQISFIHDLVLTPDLLFYVFLPTLIFESAYNMNIRRLLDEALVISVLSVVSLIVSAAIVAGAIYVVFGWIGFPIPFMIALIFGSLISATDPVAVLSLFKEYGAPRRLSMIFEGESLFNDGTAVALFLVVLSVAVGGYHGFSTLAFGGLSFVVMILGGIIMGLVFGGGFAQAVGYARDNEFISITLMLVMAHLTFILSDSVSQVFSFVGHPIHVSAIIATTVASIVMGNYGRYKISPRAEEFVEKFYGQLAFIANSLVFILIGMLFIELPASTPELIIPILLTILIVAAARALSVYPVVGLLNMVLPDTKRIPRSWQHLLSWGSLRGALAVTMVLLIPDDLIFSNWTYAFSPKELILALTVGCIFATLFIKATTIGTFMRKLRVDALTPVEELTSQEALALIEHAVVERLSAFAEKGYIDQTTYQEVSQKHQDCYGEACRRSQELSTDRVVADRALRIYAIGIERRVLKELYMYGEVNERVTKRIMGKLSIQLEHVEYDLSIPQSVQWPDQKEVLERFFGVFRMMYPLSLREQVEDQYMYYRALTILARKVLKDLDHIQKSAERSLVFSADALHDTLRIYETFRDGSRLKMERVAESDTSYIAALNTRLACRGLFKVEESVLDGLFKKELITPKVDIILHDRFEAETHGTV